MPRILNAQRLTPNALLVVFLLMLSVSASFAQIVAVPNSMSFQGRLAKPDGTPVPDGNYSIRFRLYDALTGGNVKFEQTSASVSIKNGAFSVLLTGFGAGTFNGNLWLGIKLGTDAELTPRQPLVTVPYAFKAGSVVDGSITGASLANGTITADKFASNIFNPLTWLLNGNSGVTSGFLGTTDTSPLEFRVNNRRAMLYSYAERIIAPGFDYRSINVLGGSEVNSIAPGVVGATIAGGGNDNFTGMDLPNQVNADFGTVGGGSGNMANNFDATIAGGLQNTASGERATVGGGIFNIASGFMATVGGGGSNTAIGEQATVGGGALNTASGVDATVAGGEGNTATGVDATVGGGTANAAIDNFATVGGGYQNTASRNSATVGGGSGNTASGNWATVAGGFFNTAAGQFSFAAGIQAQANHNGSFVWNDASDIIFGHYFASTGVNQFLVHATGGVGINTNNPAGFALNVNGTANFAGNITVNGTTYISDARYKQNVQTFGSALDAILNLRGVTFEWKRNDYPGMNFAEGRQIGFIAHEVEKMLPELVTTDRNGYKSVAYANVVPVLVEAVKTQQKQIVRLTTQKTEEINTLKAENAALKTTLADVLQRLERLEKRYANLP